MPVDNKQNSPNDLLQRLPPSDGANVGIHIKTNQTKL